VTAGAPLHHLTASGGSDSQVRVVWGCRGMSPLDIKELGGWRLA
jgi:hypothetical protein